MNDLTSVVSNPVGWEPGLTVEHILLSITVVSNEHSAGQFDDSCASIVAKELKKYHGVITVTPTVHYAHTKIEKHPLGCECGHCKSKPEKEGR